MRSTGRRANRKAQNPLEGFWTGLDETHGWLCRSCLHQINTACSANGPRVELKSTDLLKLILKTEKKLKMKNLLLKTYVKAQILREDCGQDLIEYALVAALIAFAAVIGMDNVASQINIAFSKIGSKLVSAVS